MKRSIRNYGPPISNGPQFLMNKLVNCVTNYYIAIFIQESRYK